MGSMNSLEDEDDVWGGMLVLDLKILEDQGVLEWSFLKIESKWGEKRENLESLDYSRGFWGENSLHPSPLFILEVTPMCHHQSTIVSHK